MITTLVDSIKHVLMKVVIWCIELVVDTPNELLGQVLDEVQVMMDEANFPIMINLDFLLNVVNSWVALDQALSLLGMYMGISSMIFVFRHVVKMVPGMG